MRERISFPPGNVTPKAESLEQVDGGHRKPPEQFTHLCLHSAADAWILPLNCSPQSAPRLSLAYTELQCQAHSCGRPLGSTTPRLERIPLRAGVPLVHWRVSLSTVCTGDALNLQGQSPTTHWALWSSEGMWWHQSLREKERKLKSRTLRSLAPHRYQASRLGKEARFCTHGYGDRFRNLVI